MDATTAGQGVEAPVLGSDGLRAQAPRVVEGEVRTGPTDPPTLIGSNLVSSTNTFNP